MKPSSICHFVFVTVLSVAFAGCASYRDDAIGVRSSFVDGRVEDTVRITGAQVGAKQDSPDILLWYLEHGTALRYANRLEESNVAFENAEGRFRYWDNQPETKISNTPVWIFSNPEETPYRGRSYDRILLNSYKALNYMTMGDMAAARVELNRSLAAQQAAVSANAKRIAEAEEAARLAKEGGLNTQEGADIPSYDIANTLEADGVQRRLNEIAAVESYIKPYGDYVNPFAVFLDGLFFTFQGTGPSDLERGRKSFNRVSQLSPNQYTLADAAMANDYMSQRALPAVTYVVFESGHAPERAEDKLSLPIFLVSSRVAYASIAFPRLVFEPSRGRFVTAEVEGRSYRTELLASVDSIVAQDFKNTWKSTVNRALVSAVAKVAASYIVEEAVRNSTNNDQPEAQLLRLFTRIAVIAYQELSTRADLRTWMTLPKEFQYARFPNPRSGVVSVLTGSMRHELTIRPDVTNVIYIREFANSSEPVVQQFYLP